jgi:hypothetical protein
MFDKLKSLVWTDDNVGQPPAAAAQPTKYVPPAYDAAHEASITAMFATNAGTFDENEGTQANDSVLDTKKIEATIRAIIEGHPDFAKYLKFTNAAVALEKVIQVESTRMQAAQATTALTKDELVASVSSYSAILANESTNFVSSFVATAEQNLESLNQHLRMNADDINLATAHLGELAKAKEVLNHEIMTKTSELAKAKIDFESVTKSISKKYDEVSAKLQQYLSA